MSASTGAIPVDDILSFGGSEYVFNTATIYDVSVSFDPNNANKFVVAYADGGNSSYGTAVVGTISGNTISYSSEYVFNSGATEYISISFDPNTANKFVVAYTDASGFNYGTAVVGTISGTSISYGSEVVFKSSSSNYISVSFDPNNANKFGISYRNQANSHYGEVIVGTVSGTSTSYGSSVVFNTGTTYQTALDFDPNTANKFVVAYRDVSNAHYGTAVVGTVSGTTISLGSEYVFNSGYMEDTTIAFDPKNANKFVVAYSDASNSNYGTALIGTVSGTSISYGSKYVYNSGYSSYISMAFDPNNSDKFIVTYRDNSNSSYGTAVAGTITSTSISYGSEYVFNPDSNYQTAIAFDPNTTSKFVVVYKDVGNSHYGTAIVGEIS